MFRLMSNKILNNIEQIQKKIIKMYEVTKDIPCLELRQQLYRLSIQIKQDYTVEIETIQKDESKLKTITKISSFFRGTKAYKDVLDHENLKRIEKIHNKINKKFNALEKTFVDNFLPKNNNNNKTNKYYKEAVKYAQTIQYKKDLKKGKIKPSIYYMARSAHR